MPVHPDTTLARPIPERHHRDDRRAARRRPPRPRPHPSTLLVGGALLAAGCAAPALRDGPAPERPTVDDRYAIVPKPRHLEPRPGEFRLTEQTRIVVEAGDAAAAARDDTDAAVD
ncbi:MAG: hypothetical protein ACODAE_03160, partial [Gemmatimonadota bacterium]